MQDLGAFKPEKTELDQEFEGKEDTRGVDNFLAWVTGHGNKQIRNIAMDGGEGAKEDYLTGEHHLLLLYHGSYANQCQFLRRSTAQVMMIHDTTELFLGNQQSDCEKSRLKERNSQVWKSGQRDEGLSRRALL